MRTALIPALAVAIFSVVSVIGQQGPGAAGFPVDEVTVQQLQEAMAAGRYTARRLVEL